MKKPSPKRIELFDLCARDILDCTDIPADLRDRLVALRAEVNALANPDNTNPADHLPVYGTAQDGSPHTVVCSCGSAPKSRASRMSMTMAHYATHLNKIGLPRNNELPRYTSGPHAGMTWEEKYRAEQAQAALAAAV